MPWGLSLGVSTDTAGDPPTLLSRTSSPGIASTQAEPLSAQLGSAASQPRPPTLPRLTPDMSMPTVRPQHLPSSSPLCLPPLTRAYHLAHREPCRHATLRNQDYQNPHFTDREIEDRVKLPVDLCFKLRSDAKLSTTTCYSREQNTVCIRVQSL